MVPATLLTGKEARASHGSRVLVSVSPWFVSPWFVSPRNSKSRGGKHMSAFFEVGLVATPPKAVLTAGS